MLGLLVFSEDARPKPDVGAPAATTGLPRSDNSPPTFLKRALALPLISIDGRHRPVREQLHDTPDTVAVSRHSIAIFAIPRQFSFVRFYFGRARHFSGG